MEIGNPSTEVTALNPDRDSLTDTLRPIFVSPIRYCNPRTLTSYPDLTITTSDGRKTTFPKVLLAVRSRYKDLLQDHDTDTIHVELPSALVGHVLRFLVTGHLPGALSNDLVGAFITMGVSVFNMTLVRVPMREVGKEMRWSAQWVHMEGEEDMDSEDDESAFEEEEDEVHNSLEDVVADNPPSSSDSDSEDVKDIERLETARTPPKFQFYHEPETIVTEEMLQEEFNLSMPPLDANYYCDKCNFGSSDEFLFKQHGFRHKFFTPDNNLWHFCTVCERGFRTQAACGKHKSTEHYEEIKATLEYPITNMYTCNLCQNDYEGSLKAHVKDCIMDAVVLKQLKDKDQFYCTMCEVFLYTSADEIIKHELVHKEKPKFFQCVQCGYKGPRKDILSHRKSSGIYHDDRCATCDILLDSYCDYQSHVSSSHDGIWQYRCGHCAKVFDTTVEQTEHPCHPDPQKPNRRSGRPEVRRPNPGVCDICGATTKNLYTHKWSHDQGQFKCPDCPRVYKVKYHLDTHRYKEHKHELDSMERPFMCDLCGKGFQKKCNLVKHKRMHAEQASQAPSMEL